MSTLVLEETYAPRRPLSWLLAGTAGAPEIEPSDDEERGTGLPVRAGTGRRSLSEVSAVLVTLGLSLALILFWVWMRAA